MENLSAQDLISTVVSLALIATLPGYPLALFLRVSGIMPQEGMTLALAPILSVGANYVAQLALNSVGVNPPLFTVPLALSVLFFSVVIRANKRELLDDLKTCSRQLVLVIPAAIVGFSIWIGAYSGQVFSAPNADGFRHNFWIRRIAETGSVRALETYVDSPLQVTNSSGGYYPFAWHSSIATWSQALDVSSPTLSLASVVFFWAVVAPLGLVFLASLWGSFNARINAYHGAVAGLFLQLIPLVPGEPMTWGSMTSAIGISVLPACVACISLVLRTGSLKGFLLPAALVAVLVVTHTPEAASCLVAFVTLVLVRVSNLSRRALSVLGGIGALAVLPAIVLFGGTLLRDLSSVKALWGAPAPSPAWSIGSLFTLTINSVGTGLPVAFLLIVGLVSIARTRVPLEALCVMAALTLVYLVSGASEPPLSWVRVLTTPWYASYERTLWVLVPFAALVMAAPVAHAVAWSISGGRWRVLALAPLSALVIWFSAVQARDVASQVREGPLLSSVIGPNDLDLFSGAAKRIGQGQVALTLGEDGGSYGYMFEGLPTTFGLAFDRDGRPNDFLATAHRQISELCSLEKSVLNAIDEVVGVVLIGERRTGFGAGGVSQFEVEQWGGLEVVEYGSKVIMLEVAPEKCASDAQE